MLFWDDYLALLVRIAGSDSIIFAGRLRFVSSLSLMILMMAMHYMHMQDTPLRTIESNFVLETAHRYYAVHIDQEHHYNLHIIYQGHYEVRMS